MNRQFAITIMVGLIVACVGTSTWAQAEAKSAVLLEDKFDAKALDGDMWIKSGSTNAQRTVRDGALRLVSHAKAGQAAVASRQNDFNFFKKPVIVVWDLVADRTLASQYAPTESSRLYAGLRIGDRTVKENVVNGAELGLTVWPGEGTNLYTLNLGKLMPASPTKSNGKNWLNEWKVDAVPQRIIWTVGPTDWSVEIKGAKFTSGDPQKRSGKHGLKEADVSVFHVVIFASGYATSMESGADFISAAVYTDQIDVVSSADAIPAFTEKPHTEPVTTESMVKELLGKDYPNVAKASKPQTLFGINWAGPEFGSLPGRENYDYGWPGAASLDYWKSKGVMLIRLPFLWERLQPKLNGPFDAQYLASLKKSVSMMSDRGMKVLLDIHNYGKYYKKNIGSADVPTAAFGDLWKRIAEEFKDNPSVWAYGLMNEPGCPDWPGAAQAAITAIRTVDQKTPIAYYGSFIKNEADMDKVKDPAGKLIYEEHMYCDETKGGTYAYSYEYENSKPFPQTSPTIGVERIQPFVEWLKKHKFQGLVGEFGVPANPDRDPRWLVVLDNVYDYLRKNEVASTYWAAGTRWSSGRMYVIEPKGGVDRPQMQILLKHARLYARAAEK